MTTPIAAGHYKDLHNFGGSGAHWAHGHTGTDLSAPCGTPVVAATAGTIQIRTDQPWAGPHLVMVSTGEGRLATWYAHMQEVDVREGQFVRAGQRIGAVGALGNATGCHLHFEVHPRGGSIYQDDIDPSQWLQTRAGPADQVRPVASTSGSSSGASGTFTLASFNVLGYSHTDRGGDRAGWASGQARMRGAVQLLDHYRVDVVGLQEFQRPQRNAMVAMAGQRYAIYSPPGDTDNSIAWRRDKWAFVSADTIPVPYFHGNIRDMPIVRLRSIDGGGDAIFMNVHNPADVHGPAGRYRAEAVRRELIAMRAIAAQYDVPAFLTGDLNARAEAFCGLTAGGTLTASAGGSHLGRCAPPKHEGIDWIFGTRRAAWLAQAAVHYPPKAGISDHPIVVARVSMSEGQ